MLQMKRFLILATASLLLSGCCGVPFVPGI